MSKAALPYSSFGRWLRQRREARDLTQQELADLAGCSGETIRKIEKDRRRPSRDMAERLAEILEVQSEERPRLIYLARLGPPRRGAASGDSPAPDVTPDDPSLATREPRLTNLPARRTSFVGREREQAQVRRLLKRKDVRLLTLTGPPGIGKTQLSFQVAAGMADEFQDGVFVVFLSPVGDASLVVPAIAQALNVKDEPHRSGLDLLIEYLRDKQMLLLLDNFEHVVDARIFVVELLEACPRLKVIVSSRQVLKVYGEHEFSVPPLSLPGTAEALRETPLHPDELEQYEAIDLFVQRSRAVKADFALTASDAPAVAEICRQLDGLPLAIELAAARGKLLSPQDMLKRLDSKLSLLSVGMRDLPERQQTLRAAIDWSHDLLDEHEEILFRRMSVFVGEATLDAIEAVAGACGPEAEDPAPALMRVDMLDLVSSLVDKSLLRAVAGGQWSVAGSQWSALSGRGQARSEATARPPASGYPRPLTTAQEPDPAAPPRSEPRFSMLWTIREYAAERLALSGEEEAIRHAHARFFLGLAEEARPFLSGSRQAAWLRRLEEERGNLRAALEWSSHTDPEMYARLGYVAGVKVI